MLKIKTKTIKDDNVVVSIKGGTQAEAIVTIVDLIDKTSREFNVNKNDLLKLITKLSKEG